MSILERKNFFTAIKSFASNIFSGIFKVFSLVINYFSDKKEHYGFVAQDVEKVFPLLVNYNESIECKTVNYIELIPLMINKMKKMQEEIDNLKQITNTKE